MFVDRRVQCLASECRANSDFAHSTTTTTFCALVAAAAAEQQRLTSSASEGSRVRRPQECEFCTARRVVDAMRARLPACELDLEGGSRNWRQRNDGDQVPCARAPTRTTTLEIALARICMYTNNNSAIALEGEKSLPRKATRFSPSLPRSHPATNSPSRPDFQPTG